MDVATDAFTCIGLLFPRFIIGLFNKDLQQFAIFR